MNEKEIRHLCSYLVELKKASAEEMRKSVYANYGAFIRFSWRGCIVRKQGTFQHRKLVSRILDTLEVLLSERRVDEALAALDEGESMAKEAKERQTLSQTILLSLETTITEQRQKLADQLAETTCQPSTRGVELHSAVLALKKLGDGPRAHTLLLNSHKQKLQASLSQIVFSTIAQAASDSLAVFDEEPAYTSELVTWAVKQTEAFALILKRHVLASSAAVGGLRVAAECVHICLAHCSLLEARRLSLSPVLLRLFRPLIEQALNDNLKRIEQSCAALAAADDWVLTYLPAGTRLASSTSLSSVNLSQPKLSSSAHRFNSMVQVIIFLCIELLS
ncbi:hypothetical protein SO802_011652 [Lithocarpus litseifolius]|uniref:Exocyst component Exo84 C-terminal domain-containing protein n=1 Tax=Lithocarpus litseifolius TaxID=425828 RepID=A0AAW2D1A3_9ROSI